MVTGAAGAAIGAGTTGGPGALPGGVGAALVGSAGAAGSEIYNRVVEIE